MKNKVKSILEGYIKATDRTKQELDIMKERYTSNALMEESAKLKESYKQYCDQVRNQLKVEFDKQSEKLQSITDYRVKSSLTNTNNLNNVIAALNTKELDPMTIKSIINSYSDDPLAISIIRKTLTDNSYSNYEIPLTVNDKVKAFEEFKNRALGSISDSRLDGTTGNTSLAISMLDNFDDNLEYVGLKGEMINE